MRRKKKNKIDVAFSNMVAAGQSGMAAVDALHEIGTRAVFYTEKAQKLAIKKLRARAAVPGPMDLSGRGVELAIFTKHSLKLIAIFELSDCYRLRKPLKGITARLKKAIQRRR